MARILLVEDSPAMRAYMRAALEDPAEGDEHLVDEAASGFDALRMLPRGAYDMVVTDINMPHINGLELVRFLRQNERHRHVAVLIVSTQSSERDRNRGLSLGADHFLAKPFSPAGLREAVAESFAARGRAGVAPAGGDGASGGAAE